MDDFSFFTIKSNGSFFDIGNGEGGADIHQPNYKDNLQTLNT